MDGLVGTGKGVVPSLQAAILLAEEEAKRQPKQFHMSQCIWRDKYKLYTDANKRRFYSDMAGLINHGFLICAENGFSSRTHSVYEYSDKWQSFGTDAFKVSPSEMTQAGRRGRMKETPYPMVTL